MKFRKKPVIIDAVQFKYSTEGINELKDFCGSALGSYGKNRHMTAVGWAEIGTLEDGDSSTSQVKHIASEGDWIIKGVSGEFYACKPDIFSLTYEKVEQLNDTLESRDRNITELADENKHLLTELAEIKSQFEMALEREVYWNNRWVLVSDQLTSIKKQQPVPHGYQLVPVEPTDELIEMLYGPYLTFVTHESRKKSYKEMLEVALVKEYELEINYAHCENPEGVRFRQYAKDPVPSWAIDIKEQLNEC